MFLWCGRFRALRMTGSLSQSALENEHQLPTPGRPTGSMITASQAYSYSGLVSSPRFSHHLVVSPEHCPIPDAQAHIQESGATHGRNPRLMTLQYTSYSTSAAALALSFARVPGTKSRRLSVAGASRVPMVHRSTRTPTYLSRVISLTR